MPSEGPNPHTIPAIASERLESWKEIANYLRRDVRTVQRWEKREGLPVYRHLHEKLGTVYAFTKEIDAWWKERSVALTDDASDAAEANPEVVATPVTEVQPQGLPSASSWKARRLKFAAQLVLVLAVVAGLVYWAITSGGDGSETADGKIRLAVLPFENLGNDPEQEYFADGLTEEMIAQVGRVHPSRLAVIAGASSLAYRDTAKTLPQIARELSAHYLLRGSVRRSGTRVRITAALIQVKDQTQIWAESYESDLREILDVQNEVSAAIARQVGLRLTPEEQTRVTTMRPVKPEAYELFLRGRFHLNRRTDDGLRRASEYFERATTADPDYVEAWVGMADAYSLMASLFYDVMPPNEAMPKAKAAVAEALRRNSSSGPAHASLAYATLIYDWNFPAAEQNFGRALELDPAYSITHHWYAHLLFEAGRNDDAAEQIRKAKELDPLSLYINQAGALQAYLNRRYDHAISECRKLLEMDPAFVPARLVVALALERQGKLNEALAELRPLMPAADRILAVRSLLGRIHAHAGRKAAAEREIQNLLTLAKTRFVPSFYVAVIYAALDDRDRAFEWLEKSFAEKYEGMVYLKVEPGFDALRSDSRFPQLLRRIGIP